MFKFWASPSVRPLLASSTNGGTRSAFFGGILPEASTCRRNQQAHATLSRYRTLLAEDAEDARYLRSQTHRCHAKASRSRTGLCLPVCDGLALVLVEKTCARVLSSADTTGMGLGRNRQFVSISGVQRTCGLLLASAEEINGSLTHDLRDMAGRMVSRRLPGAARWRSQHVHVRTRQPHAAAASGSQAHLGALQTGVRGVACRVNGFSPPWC